jgi:flagellin-like protein
MKALSPIISAVILIVAAIIGGTLAYQYFIATMASMVSKPNVVVDEAIAYTTLNTIFVKVSNMGMTPAKLKELTIYCDSNRPQVIALGSIELRPGKTVTLNATVDGQALSACSRVFVSITYTAPNFGSDITRPTEVIIVS